MIISFIKNIKVEVVEKIISGMVSGRVAVSFTGDSVSQKYSSPSIELLLRQNGEAVLVMPNLINGWPFLERVYKENRWTVISVQYEKDAIASFKYWIDGVVVRSLMAIKDSRWVWFEEGEPQPWENSNYYKANLIKKRLTKSILEEYLRANSADYALS